ncbi:MAG: patatin-like phospholipase family protein, partial [Muribaculum sp.]|nr:patatin-like phospholipase family protein [Muribaculum sp.]
MSQPDNNIPAPSERPYRLGVALSGGGARGFAHAGALKAIEEAGLKPDVIAGVSAGSVVAVLYAAGVSPDNILRLFSERGFSDFATIKPGAGGLFRADKFK